MKKNKLAIAIVLVISGLLGVAAIVTALIYSNIDDVTPEQTGASLGQNSCKEIYVEIENDTGERVRIEPTDKIAISEPTTPLIIGAQFQSAKVSNDIDAAIVAAYTEFEFTINNEHKFIVKVDSEENPMKTSSDANFTYYNPEFILEDFSIFGPEVDTMTVSVKPFGTGLDGVTIEAIRDGESCLPVIYDLDKEAIIDDQAEFCLEAGETATDYCLNTDDGEECLIAVPTCCEGTQRVDVCAQPDSDNQCTREIANCFICLTDIADGQCSVSEGENICNSPEDCTIVDEPIVEPEPEPIVDPIDEPEPEPIVDPIDEPIAEPDPIVEPEPLETSSFSVSKSGPACVERIAPLNEATFTITITNSDDSFEDILQIVDKLPLGFTYVPGSSVINGVQDLSDEYSTVSVTGSTEEIIWSATSGWSVSASGTMTIEFKALAGDSALTGDVSNEVVITPLNNPTNIESLRTEYVFSVAQSCSTPQTAIFGNVPAKAALGLFSIILAILFYSTNAGTRVSEGVVGSRFVDSIRMGYMKITTPREYFEEKFENKSRKKK